MKGVYALVVNLPDQFNGQVGALSSVTLDSGYWVYLGSARGTTSTSLEHRIRRHFSKEKKIHWHIDYLLTDNAHVERAIWATCEIDIECLLAEAIKERDDFERGPIGFGASDCRGECGSHLFAFTGSGKLEVVLISTFKQLGLTPKISSDGITQI
ncbi:MAG: GIY-YIG nuclease family protein [Candidatus Thorarchaeota archaeon]|jgi:Uri superfamily endonuclease